MELRCIKKILSVLFFFSLCSAGAQSPLPPPELISSFSFKTNPVWIKYEVNPLLSDSIKKYEAGDQSNYQIMTLKGSKASRKKTKSEFLSYINFSKSDTTNVVILPKAPMNIGFRIMIVKDSCSAFFFAFEGEPASGIFKLAKEDADYTSRILVPPKLCRVVLIQKPEFKAGEIIAGYLEFESLPYRIRYDKYYDEAEKSYVEGYFNTSDFISNKQD